MKLPREPSAQPNLLASDPAIKSQIDTDNLVANQLSFMYGDTIRLMLELQPDMSGQVSPTLVGERWQQLIGEIPQAKTFNVDASAAGPWQWRAHHRGVDLEQSRSAHRRGTVP